MDLCEVRIFVATGSAFSAIGGSDCGGCAAATVVARRATAAVAELAAVRSPTCQTVVLCFNEKHARRCEIGDHPSAGEPLDQASVVPYRLTDDGIEICLITTMKGKWGLPKGIVDAGDTVTDTALKETWEEAGLRGELEGPPLGQFEDFKWGRPLNITAYLMRVTKVEEKWPEMTVRRRDWVSVKAARKRLAESKHRPMLDAAIERLALM
jgi:8-oxo-dGTP pyrophosphatase MutT (NUDIX family)